MARILIADDEESISSSLAEFLGDVGHEVYVSPNGEHALEALQNSEGFDLLVTDMQMPKMGGVDLIKSVRSQEELADLPIIIMSGGTSMAEVDKLLKAGAMAFLSKPVNLKVLEGYVNSIVEC
jgi:DNA-binding NtrC family response regulator